MMRWISVLLLICLSITVRPPIVLAINGNDANQQEFLTFEKNVYDLVYSAMEPLNELDEKLDAKGLDVVVLSAKLKFTETSAAITKLRVPTALPNEIKTSLMQIKKDLTTGFDALEESMNVFQKYMDNNNPLLFDRFVEKHGQGVSYIDGGITSLKTVRKQLNP